MAALLWLFVPVLFPHHLLKNVLSSGAANPSLISASFPSGNPHQDYSQERPYPGECLHYFLSFAYLPSGTQLPKMNPTTMEINFELNFLLQEFSLEWFQENTSKICLWKAFLKLSEELRCIGVMCQCRPHHGRHPKKLHHTSEMFGAGTEGFNFTIFPFKTFLF